mmetsp:Transcript_73528/g.195932  ORF Transcript_73528/g.195932 Transcript_73528/m.195932 type:complete len:529 (+) Transcript_73528:79-1665(+)
MPGQSRGAAGAPSVSAKNGNFDAPGESKRGSRQAKALARRPELNSAIALANGVTKVQAVGVGELDAEVVRALKDKKHRVFLLKLEDSMRQVVSNEEIDNLQITTALDAFHRMLVHRVADYFGFERVVEQLDKDSAAIKLIKTEQTRLPERRFAALRIEEKTPKPSLFLAPHVSEVPIPPFEPQTISEVLRQEQIHSEATVTDLPPQPAMMIMRRQADSRILPTAGSQTDASLQRQQPQQPTPGVLATPAKTASDGDQREQVSGEADVYPNPKAGLMIIKRKDDVSRHQRERAAREEAAKNMLTLEEREQAYIEARARIFGEAEMPEAEDSEKLENDAQRRQDAEKHLDRIMDMEDPAYSRNVPVMEPCHSDMRMAGGVAGQQWYGMGPWPGWNGDLHYDMSPTAVGAPFGSQGATSPQAAFGHPDVAPFCPPTFPSTMRQQVSAADEFPGQLRPPSGPHTNFYHDPRNSQAHPLYGPRPPWSEFVDPRGMQFSPNAMGKGSCGFGAAPVPGYAAVRPVGVGHSWNFGS